MSQYAARPNTKKKMFVNLEMLMEGAIFHCSAEIKLKSAKNVVFFYILHAYGGAVAPPEPPGYATDPK